MFHVYWPATACLTLVLIVGVIMAMLKYGTRLCNLRHVTFRDRDDWDEEAATYDREVSYNA